MGESTIEFGWVAENVAVIKINGRGSFQNSMSVQQLSEELRKKHTKVRLIIDLKNCVTMDSTFMGTLAGISVEQNKTGADYLTIVNTEKHTNQLLRNLGLSYILDIREKASPVDIQEKTFHKAGAGKSISKFEQIIHMIKAHKQLVDLDSENEVRFQSVIKYLEDSLDREKKKENNS
jgi:anti-sigma B factor antagonist